MPHARDHPALEAERKVKTEEWKVTSSRSKRWKRPSK